MILTKTRDQYYNEISTYNEHLVNKFNEVYTANSNCPEKLDFDLHKFLIRLPKDPNLQNELFKNTEQLDLLNDKADKSDHFQNKNIRFEKAIIHATDPSDPVFENPTYDSNNLGLAYFKNSQSLFNVFNTLIRNHCDLFLSSDTNVSNSNSFFTLATSINYLLDQFDCDYRVFILKNPDITAEFNSFVYNNFFTNIAKQVDNQTTAHDLLEMIKNVPESKKQLIPKQVVNKAQTDNSILLFVSNKALEQGKLAYYSAVPLNTVTLDQNPYVNASDFCTIVSSGLEYFQLDTANFVFVNNALNTDFAGFQKNTNKLQGNAIEMEKFAEIYLNDSLLIKHKLSRPYDLSDYIALNPNSAKFNSTDCFLKFSLLKNIDTKYLSDAVISQLDNICNQLNYIESCLCLSVEQMSKFISRKVCIEQHNNKLFYSVINSSIYYFPSELITQAPSELTTQAKDSQDCIDNKAILADIEDLSTKEKPQFTFPKLVMSQDKNLSTLMSLINPQSLDHKVFLTYNQFLTLIGHGELSNYSIFNLKEVK